MSCNTDKIDRDAVTCDQKEAGSLCACWNWSSYTLLECTLLLLDQERRLGLDSSTKPLPTTARHTSPCWLLLVLLQQRFEAAPDSIFAQRDSNIAMERGLRCSW